MIAAHISRARQALAGACAALASSAALAQAIEIPPRMMAALKSGDCALVVNRLNETLRSNRIQGLLIGGMLYERGFCLKPSAEKARDMYARAHGLGEPKAVHLLTSLSASAEGGSDAISTLWWAREASLTREIDVCSVPQVQAAADPESFARQLGAWPRDRLEACRWMLGVSAALRTSLWYPDQALSLALEGQFRVQASLPEGSVKVTAEQRNSSDDTLLDHVSKQARVAAQRIALPALPVAGRYDVDVLIVFKTETKPSP